MTEVIPAVVRPAGRRDLPELARLAAAHATYERQPLSEEEARARLASSVFAPRSRLACLVAERDGVLVGYATHSSEASTWGGRPFTHMDCLFVDEDARGGGVGERLLAAVADAALARGHVEVQWQTPDWNVDAARFYDRLGATSLAKRRYSLDEDACRRLAPEGDDAPRGEAPLGPFELRVARFAGVSRRDGWALRVHAIAASPDGVDEQVLDGARDAAFDVLPRPATSPTRYGVGFMVVHAGLEAVWLLVDWWTAGDLLDQRLLAAPLSDPDAFVDITDTTVHACVHEMEVIEAERRAWIERVLRQPERRDLEGYLSAPA